MKIYYLKKIASLVIKVANERKVVLWEDIINDLSEIIKSNYDGKNKKSYRGDWKRKIKLVIKAMGYELKRFDSDTFITLESPLPNSESTNTKFSGCNYKLKDHEVHRIVNAYKSIPAAEKWVLTTGKIVNDEMEKLAESSLYEHPVHSMNLEPTDPIWGGYFTAEELNEIKTFRLKALPSMSGDLSNYLDKYDRDWKSGEELYSFADSQKHNPITEFTKKWVRESVTRASELFLYENALALNDYSESDLLHEVWPFVYRVFKDKSIRAALGERASVAVALGRNEDRKIEAIDKRPRKNTGAKVDILFKISNSELGSCEVGKDNVTTVDDKYFDDGLIKLPKTLRDMLLVLCQKNPSQVNNLFTIGFLMMGLTLELVILDCPVGSHITRVSRTRKLDFPTTLSAFSLDFLPLIEVAWKGKEAMKNNLEVLNNRKRKAVELLSVSKEEGSVRMPYSFVRS